MSAATPTRAQTACTLVGNVCTFPAGNILGVGLGGSDGAAVLVSGGDANTLTIGASGSLSAASNSAVVYKPTSLADGSLTVTNQGTVTGSLIGTTASGSNAAARDRRLFGTVINARGGQLNSGARIDADLINRGTLAVGGEGEIATTSVAGDFTQGASGLLQVDGDFKSGRADRVRVAGDTALGGRVAVTSPTLLPDRPLIVVAGKGDVTGTLEAEDSRLFDFATQQTDGGFVTVTVESGDFTASSFGLTGNESAAAGHLDSIWKAGGGPYGSLFATLNELAESSNGAYTSAVADLSPGVSNALAAQNGLIMNRRFNALMSCPFFEGESVIMGQSNCLWMETSGGGLSMSEKDGATGYSDSRFTLSLGGQQQLAEDWFLGLAGSYTRNWLNGNDGRVQSQGDTAFLGASLKWQVVKRGLVSLAAGGSFSWLDNERRISIPGASATASSSPNFWSAGGRLHMEYVFDLGGSTYLMPYQDVDFIYTVTPRYRETGAGALDLLVDEGSKFSFNSTKAVEVGTRNFISPGILLKTYASAGITVANHQDWTTDARLIAAPEGAGEFSSTIPVDKYYGRVGGGLQLQAASGLDVRLEYDGAVSGHSTSHIGSLRLGYRF
ncbi:MAG: hypothetical protein Kilf2KO_34540 [Rhodospirillales bacterium]